MWKEGAISIPKKNGANKIVHYWIKVYEEGRTFGINNGRISKLTLKMDGEIIANYSRGWDIEATTEKTQLALCILLTNHN